MPRSIPTRRSTSRRSAPRGHLHPDFGTNPSYGIPYVVVGPDQPRVPISFTEFGEESNPGPYPVPPERAGGGGRRRRRPPRARAADGHAASCTSSTRRVAAAPDGRRARAPSSTCAATRCAPKAGPRPTRPACRSSRCSSATARCTPARSTTRCGSPCERTQRGYIHPATHFASDSSDPEPAADGPAPATEGELQPRRLPRRGARGAARAQALRADRGRQRLLLVHHRRTRPALERRRPEPAEDACPARRSRRCGPGRSCTAASRRSAAAARYGRARWRLGRLGLAAGARPAPARRAAGWAATGAGWAATAAACCGAAAGSAWRLGRP